MRRRTFLAGTAAAAFASTLAGCLSAAPAPEPSLFREGRDGASAIDGDALGVYLDGTASTALTDTERDDLFWMREEEKLARDVYRVLADRWELQTHENVAEAEQTHMDAMLGLLEHYDLTDPATGTPGTFTDPALQALYDDLVAWGQASAIDALAVGCRIEETDIQDIQVRIDRTDERPIHLVYENLLKGSRNHLRAFYRAITAAGGDYEPAVISREAFDDIVDSDWETGRN